TSVTRALGSFLHGRRSNIDFGLVKLILLGSLPATIASYLLLPVLRAELGISGLDSLLTELLAALLVLASVIGISRTLLQRRSYRETKENDVLSVQSANSGVLVGQDSPTQSVILSSRDRAFIVAAGAFVGFAVQMTSVGSGTILIFLLMFLFKNKKMVGTDIFHAFILTSLGAFLHFGLGNVDLAMVAALVAGGIPGIFLGVRLLSFVSLPRLRSILNVVIMGAGLTLILHLLA
ncbi:MAG: sulfite exporter TauE/SafE family protein, partial [Nitrososphaerales archaeon]